MVKKTSIQVYFFQSRLYEIRAYLTQCSWSKINKNTIMAKENNTSNIEQSYHIIFKKYIFTMTYRIMKQNPNIYGVTLIIMRARNFWKLSYSKWYNLRVKENACIYILKIVKRAFLLAVNRIIQTSPELISRDLIEFG